jgi:hypothetical protein
MTVMMIVKVIVRVKAIVRLKVIAKVIMKMIVMVMTSGITSGTFGLLRLKDLEVICTATLPRTNLIPKTSQHRKKRLLRVIDIETAVNRGWQEYSVEEIVRAVQDNDGRDDDSKGGDQWDFWILKAKRLKAEAERNWYWYPEDLTTIEEATEENVIDIEAAVNGD